MSPTAVEPELPRRGRLAGIDFGTVRIGIAVTNEDQTLASPLEIYTRRGPQHDQRYFQELVSRERVVAFVVGLPLHLSGDDSRKSEEARQFGQWLAKCTSRPVGYFDERFTTAFAEQALQNAGLTKQQRKKRLDKLAAQIMLSAYLESTSRGADRQPLDDGST